MIKNTLIAKTCFYASIAIAIGSAFTSCNGVSNAGIPAPPAGNAQPVVQSLRFSKPKKLAWADVKAAPVRPVLTKVAWNKLPEQAEDTTGFRSFKYPVQETQFDYGALPVKDLDIDNLPSKPLKFKTYVLPPPKLIKGGRPELKNGSLYLVGLGEDKTEEIAVTRILNDGEGFLWITSDEGVYRFDGENLLMILSYTEELYDYGMIQDGLGNIWLPNSAGELMILEPKAGLLKKSVPGQGLDNLQHLMLDRHQQIWATDQLGDVKIIDTKTQAIKILNNKNGLFTTVRTAGIAEDKSGKIWVSTGGGGLNIIDPASKKIKHLDQAHGLKSDRANNIVFDHYGRLWMGMYGGGINVIDPQKKSIQAITEIQSDAEGVMVSSLLEDEKGIVWIGTTASGVTAIDLINRSVMHLDKNKGLASNRVFDITQDNKGQMWIGTSSGLNMIGNSQAVLHRDGTNLVYNLMEDRHGLIWQGTLFGVDILDRKKNTSRHLGTKQGLDNDTVHFIAENNGKIFINTANSLEILDTIKQTITNFKSIYSNILFDKAGRVWFLDEAERGINLYDPKNQTIKHFGKEILQLGDFIYFMCLDAQGRIWLSNSAGQVGLINPDAGTFQFLTNVERGRSRSSTHFLTDDKGNIWIGTDKGIYIADIKNQTVVYFSAAQGLIDNKVLSMVQHKGSIYAGTNLGVTVITPPVKGVSAKENWQAISYAFNRQYADNYNSDLVTRDGTYWLGDIGVTAFDLAQKKLFEPAAYVKGISLYDHPMYFFDKTAFKTSATDTLWRQNSEIYFSQGQTPVNTGSAFKNGLKWDSVTGAANLPVNLQIPYNQNFIHFHYGNLNFIPHSLTRYRYILSGVDKNWSEITSDTSTVNYMNLQPGYYTFEVVALSEGNIAGPSAKFSFTVDPPWWKTWWAYLIYALVFAGAIWGFVRYRSRQLVKEKSVLEDKVKLATEEVMQQKEEIAAQRDSLETQRNDLEKTLDELKTTQTQLIQSEKMASLGELTAGIAHEIQNPLNFVNNFSEVSVELLEELKEEAHAGNTEDVIQIASDLVQNLEKIRHHGKRADSIVKGMLEHSRARGGQKEPTNINAMAEEYLRLSYHGLRAKDKTFNAEMVTHFDPKLPKINVSQQDIGRVMLNLFNNAFYAVNQKTKTAGADYKPTVEVETFFLPLQGVGGLKVKDNGIGIPEAIKEKIMQPFFTTKPTGEGTGLGLSLTYDIVVKGHEGSIVVDTKEGEFSVFTIQLPIK